MPDQFSNLQQIRKPAVVSKGGIVAAQSRKAAAVGAEVLAAGGDCVDAVIATGFALGVLEPWMSGLGGGGAMVLYRAREDRYEVIDFGMRAPLGLRPADYPLSGDGVASDLFPWARSRTTATCTVRSIAVPGVADGMGEAHRRHAKLPWRELLAPAIKLAERRPAGRLVDRADDFKLGRRPAALSREPAAYLEDGLPPNRAWGIRSHVRIAAGPAEGDAGTSRRKGPARFLRRRAGARASPPTSKPRAARYRPRTSRRSARMSREPLAIPYRGGTVYATPELTCGPTLAHALRILQQNCRPRRAARTPRPTAPMHRRCRRPIASGSTGMGDVDGRRALGAEHIAPACTSHFCVVDRHGNMAAVTQTLLSIFGSRFVTPQNGILMNNGIMWFDPSRASPTRSPPASAA